ncbi:hypothetical protein ILUMI_23497 [Ignelater luminosus]|uniref:Major facilitator superfamily (MFS) profile domain-containing protein n=1 Tax=Ignelater luminosus TaxID=2038154 RepID=A0A8K0G1U2_IGNLU|nr:hypothetical protein ILUMI_23497 [Ignelater luminosus]
MKCQIRTFICSIIVKTNLFSKWIKKKIDRRSRIRCYIQKTICSTNGKRKFSRSRSLAHLAVDSYTPGEIRRIRERLLRTNSRIERSFLQTLDKSQRMTLLLLAFVDFMCFCSMSIMAPFFPREAAEKGLSDTLSGFVFSFYALIMFMMSPIVGKILPRFGTKYLFISGIFLTGACNLLFGLLEFIEDYYAFTTFCLLIRGLEALGASAFSTASYVLVVHSFPENIGSVLGILETFVGLGMSVGPAVGGMLYSVGGFDLPFFVLGVTMILVIPLTIYLLPPINDVAVSGKGQSVFKLIKVPAVAVTSLIVVVASSTWAFLDPTLEPHLRQYVLSPQQIGLIFLLFSALYGIFSPIWGWVADKVNSHWSMMVWGLAFSTVSLLMLGPCPYIPFLENSLWLDVVALCTLGITVALVLLPTFQGILKSAIAGGCEDSLPTYSLVAGVWSCMYSLGEVIGPSLGGFILEHYGFPVCSTVMAVMTFIMCIIAFIYFYCVHQNNVDGDNSSDSGISGSWNTESSEYTSLLGSKSEINHHRLYVEEKIYHYEQSRKMDYEIGDLDRNQVTDVRGTLSITPKGSCEA